MRNSVAESVPQLPNLLEAKEQVKRALEPLSGLCEREKEQVRDRLLDASGGVCKFLAPVWDDGRLLVAGAGWHNGFLFLAPHFREATVWDPDLARIAVFRRLASAFGLSVQFESGDLNALLGRVRELDLIVFEESLNPIRSRTLRKAAVALSERGECVISVRSRNFLKSFVSLNRWVKGLARRLGRDVRDRRAKVRSASLYRTLRSARKAQLPHRQLYFLHPSQASPKEIVGWGRTEPTETRHPLVRALSHFGAGKHLYASPIVVAKRSAEQTSFVEQLLRHIQKELALHGTPAIDHCAISNGNTALFFVDLDESRKATLRLPLCGVALRRAEIERSMLQQAQEISSAYVRTLLPKVITHGIFRHQPYLLRSYLPGTDVRSSLKARVERVRLVADAAEVLLHWCQDFQEVIEVTPAACDHYFLSHIRNARPYLSQYSGALGEIEDCLRSYTIGQSLPLSFVHGDFHFGNLTVHPETKRLVGILDWDLGEQHGLPMLDLFHLLCSWVREDRSWGIGTTFLSTLWPGSFEPEEQLLVERHRRVLSISDSLVSCLKVVYWARHCLGNLARAGGLKPAAWMQENVIHVVDALPHLLRDVLAGQPQPATAGVQTVAGLPSTLGRNRS